MQKSMNELGMTIDSGIHAWGSVV